MTDQTAINIFDLGDLSAPWCLRVAVTLRLAEYIQKELLLLLILPKRQTVIPRYYY